MKLRENLPPALPTCKRTKTSASRLQILIELLLLAVLIALTLPGCASSTIPLQAPPAELLHRCETLAPLEDGTAGALAFKIVEVAAQYYDCAARFDALIDAVSR